MRKRLSKIVFAVIILVAMAGFSLASEQVRIIPDITSINATTNLTQRGESGVDFNVAIPGIAINTVTLNSKDYKRIDLPNGDKMTVAELAEDGKPDIPVWTMCMAIPDQAGISLDVTYSGFDVIEDIDMAPVQPPHSESNPTQDIPFTLDEATYNADSFYPGNLADAGEPFILRDIRGVQITLCPVQYNPVRREARVYRDLAVSISFEGEVINPKTIRRPYLSEGFYPLYKSMFANFEELYSTSDVQKGGYVIIVKPNLADTLKALALWKHKLGFPVRIVRTTEINSNGNPSASQILTFLTNAYANWEIPPEYVMIVGDKDNTGNNGTGVNDYPYSDGGNTYASDHNYACVDGSDFLPDIFVARLSIDNISQLRIALSKIFKYEEKPFMGDPTHWIRGLSVAYTYYESSRLTVLWVRQLQLRHGFAQVDTVCTQDFDSRLSGFMRSGPAYIQYRGAGGSDGWAGPSWTISDLLQQPNNQKLGIMSPLTCGTGDFNVDVCFGETWIRMGLNPDSLKGGPAYYGVSDHNTHTRWNNPIMIGYFFGIFEENIPYFAAAAVRGKIQEYLTFPRNRGRGDYVELYFHTYNMLGDPALELRTAIPQNILVSHSDTMALGLNHIEVSVSDSQGNPIREAVVTLIKAVDSTEEVFSVAKTDDNGNTSLSFNALTTGSMYLTVSGKNLIPYEANVEIINSDLAVGFDSLSIDDDNYDQSSGNGDGIAGSGETIELNVSLKNFGISQQAVNLSTLLEPLDATVSIFDASRNYGDLGPGESRMSEQPYLIYVNPKAHEGDLIRLRQTVTDGNNHSWYSVIEIPVMAPKFVVANALVVDANNRLDPGDTVSLYLELQNIGSVAADNITAILSTTDDYTHIISNNAFYQHLGIGDTLSNNDTPLRLTIAPETFEGRSINFILATTTLGGAKLDIPFSIPVGAITGNDPIGPDAYGYYIFDSADTNYVTRPTYGYVEINPNAGGHGGTRLTFGSNDDNSALVTLPFDMKYYGDPYGALIVSINGFVSPDTFRMDSGGHFWANFFNWPIPDPGNARGQISPLWDDLSFTGSNYGVYTWNDTVNNLFYIEWYHMTNRNTSAIETFQLVISNPIYHPTLTGDSEFWIYYNDVTNNDVSENYATVGFESWDEQRGIQYTHDNVNTPGAIPLADNRALRFTTNTGRGGIKGQVDLHNGGSSADVRVSSTTGQYRMTDERGEFWLRDVPPGVVSVTAQCLGYFPRTLDSIVVDIDKLTQGVNIAPDSCPLPSNLQATDSLSHMIQLSWSAVSHPNVVGYYIYRSRWENGVYTKLNLNPVTDTHYTDTSIPDSNQYWYYVSAVFTNGTWVAESFGSDKDSGRAFDMTGIAEIPQVPTEFFLAQNYPNPFNPTTSISFGLPQDSDVKVEIFNVLGQRVKTLVQGAERAGYKTVIWDGKDESGKGVASGMYFYRVEAGSFNESKKMTLLK